MALRPALSRGLPFRVEEYPLQHFLIAIAGPIPADAVMQYGSNITQEAAFVKKFLIKNFIIYYLYEYINSYFVKIGE